MSPEFSEVAIRERVTSKVQMMFLEQTPAQISRPILDLCRELDDAEQPEYVNVCPVEGGKRLDCFINVRSPIQENGGQVLFGWAIWEWPGVMIEAEFHAVWRQPEGTKLDITPNCANVTKILFLPDSKRTYDYGANFQKIDNVRRALTKDRLVSEFIEHCEWITKYEEEHSPGPVLQFSDDAQELYHQGLMNKKHELIAKLQRKYAK